MERNLKNYLKFNLLVKSFKFIHTADLHLGFNFSERKWKSGIKQRSDDFLDNFNIIMKRAQQDDIDFIILAGDIFNRSKPHPIIREIIIEKLSFLSLKKPVIVIPGNHDKSRFNIGLLAYYPNLVIFNSPAVRQITIKDLCISITGIPFLKKNTLEIIQETIVKAQKNKGENYFSLLILHELIESSRVGFLNFEFKKYMKKVVPIDLIDNKFDYIAMGHVHKYQVIEKAVTPICYPGSIERTSIVERDEEKGYLIVNVDFSDNLNIKQINPSFVLLPTRKMIYYKFTSLRDLQTKELEKDIKEKISILSKLPLVTLSIKDITDYEKYKEIRNFLKELKLNDKIFDYYIPIPSFLYKQNEIPTEEKPKLSYS